MVCAFIQKRRSESKEKREEKIRARIETKRATEMWVVGGIVNEKCLRVFKVKYVCMLLLLLLLYLNVYRACMM